MDNEQITNGWFKDKKRDLLTLALAMLVLFWRVIIPTHVEINIGIGILIMALDLALTTAIVLVNIKKLKYIFTKKFTWKDALTLVIAFVAMTVLNLFIPNIAVKGVSISSLADSAPAQLVVEKYREIFPIGAFVSTAICAPIFEETAFRMAGRKLIKNGVLFVIITSLLFAFIHTVNFSIGDNAFYFYFGILMSSTYLITKDIRITMLLHFLVNFSGSISSLISR